MPNNETYKPIPPEITMGAYPDTFTQNLLTENDEFYKEITKLAINTSDTLGPLLTANAREEFNKSTKLSAEISDTKIKLNDPQNIDTTILTTTLNAAKRLLLYHEVEKRKEIAKKDNRFHHYEQLANYQQLSGSSIVQCKIGPLSVADLASNKKLPASAIFSSYLESIKTDNETPNSYRGPLADKYPNKAKDIYIHAKATMLSVLCISNLSPQTLERQDLIEGNSKTTREIIRKAKEILIQTKHHINTMPNTLLEPDSVDFLPLKEQIENFFSKNEASDSIQLLRELGIIKNVLYDYRTAKKLAERNIKNTSDFYHLLSEELVEYAQPYLAEDGYLTNDDIPTILDADKIIPEVKVSIEDLKRPANAIFQKSKRKQYTINPEKINWKNLLPPESVDLHFPSESGRKFNIRLFYKNELGESLKLNFGFDTKNNIIDWLFMDDPDDPSMKAMRDALIHSSYSILAEAAQQAESEHQQKQLEKLEKSKTLQAATSPSKKLYIPKEKAEDLTDQQFQPPPPRTPRILQNAITGPSSPEVQKIKNQIILPSKKEFTDIMNQISHPDQLRIIQGIENYNQNALGKFQMLAHLKKDDEKLYSLKVNCGPRGGARVLVQETKSEDTPSNTREFKIIDIGYRKDIYRKR
jgi:hypothetical protein